MSQVLRTWHDTASTNSVDVVLRVSETKQRIVGLNRLNHLDVVENSECASQANGQIKSHRTHRMRRPEVVLFQGLIPDDAGRSEEHTSELQSRENLVCRLLLEKKKTT